MGNERLAQAEHLTEQRALQVNELQNKTDILTSEKNAVNDTKTALIMQISRLTSELAKLRSRITRDKRERQNLIMEMSKVMTLINTKEKTLHEYQMKHYQLE